MQSENRGEPMSKTIVIANQKGGVSKTSTVHCMATGLSHMKYNVLAVDTDPQGNLTYIMGADPNKPGVYELLNDKILAPDAVQQAGQGPIISSNTRLANANREMTGKEAYKRLANALEPFKAVYDYIIIDTPPAMGILVINALAAADDVIIPMTADALSLQGLSQLYSTIKAVKKTNPALNVAGILLCRYSGRTVIAREIKQLVAERAGQMETRLFNTTIRESVALKEIQAKISNPYGSFFKSKPANDYLSFIAEYLGDNHRSLKLIQI